LAGAKLRAGFGRRRIDALLQDARDWQVFLATRMLPAINLKVDDD